MESKKRGSVPVNWQKLRTALTWRAPRVQQYSIRARIQWVNPPPLTAALTLQQCLYGDTEETYHQEIDRSGLTPASRLQ
ncbi:hypothetical protein TNCV_3652611 [Trichonephila clavipes]|nr:hypothetical protein TNCV_3652611 [Trichonephila clavipes]